MLRMRCLQCGEPFEATQPCDMCMRCEPAEGTVVIPAGRAAVIRVPFRGTLRERFAEMKRAAGEVVAIW